MAIANATLSPFKGVGEIRFGMSKTELRTLLNQPYVFMEEERDTYFEGWYQPQRDYFETDGIKVEYDKDDRCLFIEVGPEVELNYEGVYFFKSTCAELHTFFRKIDPAFETAPPFMESPFMGMSITMPQGGDGPPLLIGLFHHREDLLSDEPFQTEPPF